MLDFITANYIWIILVILGLVVLAVIGYVADKQGYFGKKNKEELDDDLVDFSELSRPKEEEANTIKAKEEDISSNFDELPDVSKDEMEFETLPSTETEEDLYAPFGDQAVKEEVKDLNNVVEVEDDTYNQSFVDIEKIESEAIDINNEEDKRDIEDLMRGQFDMEFEMEEVKEEKEEKKKETNKTKKTEDDGITDMWKF